MKKYIKLISIILLIILMLSTVIYAGEVDPDKYKPGGMEQKDKNKTGKIIGSILSNVKVVGICISVVVLAVIGLKYILSSIEEKANYKENMLPYIVGVFLLASATTIPSLVYDLMN